MPEISSACNWHNVPAIVSGEVDPAIGDEARATGIDSLTTSMRTSVVSESKQSGLRIHPVINEIKGFFLSSSIPPHIMAAISIICFAPSTV